MTEVLVLQHATEEPLGAIGHALERRGHAWRTIRVFAGEPVPERLAGAGALVVMGGPMSAYDTARFPYLADELRLIAAAVDEARPVLGVCLGSQLLAAALGAHVCKGPRKEIGWHRVQLHVDLQRDPLFGDIGRTIMAFHWHGDVFDLPAGAVSLGHSERTLHQGFRFGPRVYGVLFHLEVTGEQVDSMLRSWGAELAEAGTDERAILDGKTLHLTEVQALGTRVFDAWAALLG